MSQTAKTVVSRLAEYIEEGGGWASDGAAAIVAAAMGWNFDILQVPLGRMVVHRHMTKNGWTLSERFAPDRVILATKCGKVTVSHWLPDEERWVMLAKGEEPVAWMAWPTHPHSASALQEHEASK